MQNLFYICITVVNYVHICNIHMCTILTRADCVKHSNVTTQVAAWVRVEEPYIAL